ncbi:MAG TPA: hypothetical protein VNY05_30960, partial [Candidatus Acidoferrales bacterium]|nr:hypothetical protein [Candidatus Acidoferrales bacterium]
NLTHADWMDDSIQNNSPLGHSYQNALEAFSRLQRRIEYTNRMYLRTLKALQDLQKPGQAPGGDTDSPVTDGPVTPAPEATAGPVIPATEPASPETQPLTPPIGFVPSFTPATGELPHVSHENHQSPSPRHHL